MKKIAFAVLPFRLLLSGENAKKIPGTIKVSGEGKIRVKPDLIILTIDISFTNYQNKLYFTSAVLVTLNQLVYYAKLIC